MNEKDYFVIASASAAALMSVWAKISNKTLYRFMKPLPLAVMIVFLFLRAAETAGTGFFYKAVLAGLTLGLLGDVLLLGSRRFFAIGMLLFMLGHIAYIASFSSLAKEISLIAVLPVIPALVFIKILRSRIEGEMQNAVPAILAYLSVILVMCFCAFNADLSRGGFPFFALGSLLFCASDALLVWGSFVKSSKTLQAMVLVLYYPAQILIACGALFILISSRS